MPASPRAIEQQKVATAKVRNDAERKLDEAERNVERAMLGRSRKRKLEAEVALNRRVIEMCDRQLARLENDPRLRSAMQGRRPALPPATLAPELTIDRMRDIEL